MVIEIIVALLLFILFLPIKVNFLFYINLLANKGALAVKVFTQPVMQDKFKIASGQVTAKNNYNKEKVFELSKEDKTVIFIESFINNITHKIIIDNTFIGVEVGNKDDAMVTALLSGGILMIVDLLFAQLYTRKNGANYDVDSEPLFCQNKIVISAQAQMYVNLFDVLFAFGKSYLKTIKRIRDIAKTRLEQEC